MNKISPSQISNDKYRGKTIRWIEKPDHYELIFTDDFITPSSAGIGHGGDDFLAIKTGSSLLTDIVLDMREGDKTKEVHVFIASLGGEVAALNMIMQQLLSYEYRVGINLGTACSCGWMLLFACHERYVSPFSQTMYHDISSICGGKHAELQRNAEFMNRWQKELLQFTDTEKVLTGKELELGKTTEVWLTGQELIDRGAAKPYSEYEKRKLPKPVAGFINIDGHIFCRRDNGWQRMIPADEPVVQYSELACA
ncbi:MAG: ATP-dependent Clp protease proteolytic subunit [Lentisphaeria bacterium]|nr:ATP-dependent Clp protease proteolytic subunit [Lentisphaeria bacterium]